MSLIRPSRQEIFDAISYEFERRLGVTNFGDSSIAGTIAKVMADKVDAMWAQIEQVDTQNNLLTATGADLNRIGESHGIFRQVALPNHSIGSIGVTFTNIGSQVTIPVGTVVWCSTRPNSKFSTLTAVTLGVNQSSDVGIVSEGVGDFYNVLPGEIDRCDLTSEYVTVSNRYSIYNGSNGEVDADYRNRIIQSFTAAVLGSESSIQDGLMNVPGVRNAKLYPAKRGPGTLDVLVIPRSEITTGLLTLCNIILSERVAAGIDYRLLTPMPKRLDVSVQLLTSNNTAITDYTKTAIENAVYYFVDNVDSQVSLESLKADLYRTDPTITSLSISIFLDGAAISSNATIYLNEGEILTIGTVEVK